MTSADTAPEQATVISTESGSVSSGTDSKTQALKADLPNEQATEVISASEEKQEESVLDENDKKAILKQVEFYFSIYNLPMDKFLRTLTETKEGGYIPIATILSFKKMEKFSKFSKQIPDVLRSSPKLLEVSEDSLSVRRKVPIPNMSSFKKETFMDNSLHLSSFPLDSNLESLQTELQELLLIHSETLFGAEAVSNEGDLAIGRLDPVTVFEKREKKFLGSVRVSFLDEKTSQQFLEHFQKNPLLFREEKLYVSKNRPGPIVHSSDQLVRVEGLSAQVRKSEYVNYFKSLSTERVTVEFSNFKSDVPPFAIVIVGNNSEAFASKIHSTPCIVELRKDEEQTSNEVSPIDEPEKASTTEVGSLAQEKETPAEEEQSQLEATSTVETVTSEQDKETSDAKQIQPEATSTSEAPLAAEQPQEQSCEKIMVELKAAVVSEEELQPVNDFVAHMKRLFLDGRTKKGHRNNNNQKRPFKGHQKGGRGGRGGKRSKH